MLDDYDGGYLTSTMKGGYKVSLQDKIDELHYRYESKYSRHLSIDNDENSQAYMLIISSLLGITSIGGYIYLSIHRKKTN